MTTRERTFWICLFTLLASILFAVGVYKIHGNVMAFRAERIILTATAFLAIAGVVISSVGAILSAMAEIQARKAAKNSEATINELTEQQMLSGFVADDYGQVFQKHLLDPMDRVAAMNVRIHAAKLLLSTPSYGSPPLDKRAYDGLPRLIENIDRFDLCLFTPDAHYPHWANVILSQGYEKEDAATQFIERLCTTMDCLATRMHAHEDTTHVWAIEASPVRMTYFKHPEKDGGDCETAFVVLADTVSLGKPLRSFTGRCFGVPRGWHAPLIADDKSFYEQLKICPYSQKEGVDARMKRDELQKYKWDLVFGRTAHHFLSIAELQSVVDRLAVALKRHKLSASARELTICAFHSSVRLAKKVLQLPERPSSQTNEMWVKIVDVAVKAFGDSLLTETGIAFVSKNHTTQISKLKDELLLPSLADQFSAADPRRGLCLEVAEYIKAVNEEQRVWLAALFLIITGGCGQSAYAQGRS